MLVLLCCFVHVFIFIEQIKWTFKIFSRCIIVFIYNQFSIPRMLECDILSSPVIQKARSPNPKQSSSCSNNILCKSSVGFNPPTSPKYIPDKKRNAPLRTVQLSGKSQVIDQFSLYQCKGISGTAASPVFCNQASKLC